MNIPHIDVDDALNWIVYAVYPNDGGTTKVPFVVQVANFNLQIC